MEAVQKEEGRENTAMLADNMLKKEERNRRQQSQQQPQAKENGKGATVHTTLSTFF